MDSLRRVPFFVALALFACVVLVELGSGFGFVHAVSSTAQTAQAALPAGPVRDALALDDARQQFDSLSAQSDRPPGLGISYIALLDGIVLFTVALVGLSLILPERIQGRAQGCVTFVVGLLIIVGGIVMIFVALALVILMVSLLLAVPFGTLAYFAIYGRFNTGASSVVLSLLMFLKLAFAVCLVVAQQRFLQNVGLVLLVLTSLVANIVVAFLHGLVPGFLVSITDGIAAIIVAILAVIWAILLLIGSLPAIINAIRLQA